MILSLLEQITHVIILHPYKYTLLISECHITLAIENLGEILVLDIRLL